MSSEKELCENCGGEGGFLIDCKEDCWECDGTGLDVEGEDCGGCYGNGSYYDEEWEECSDCGGSGEV